MPVCHRGSHTTIALLFGSDHADTIIILIVIIITFTIITLVAPAHARFITRGCEGNRQSRQYAADSRQSGQ
jgi:hypothetical protein